jgi:hypothetical protein
LNAATQQKLKQQPLKQPLQNRLERLHSRSWDTQVPRTSWKGAGLGGKASSAGSPLRRATLEVPPQRQDEPERKQQQERERNKLRDEATERDQERLRTIAAQAALRLQQQKQQQAQHEAQRRSLTQKAQKSQQEMQGVQAQVQAQRAHPQASGIIAKMAQQADRIAPEGGGMVHSKTTNKICVPYTISEDMSGDRKNKILSRFNEKRRDSRGVRLRMRSSHEDRRNLRN